MLALKAENISKQYRLGQVGTGTLSHDLNRFWHQIRGKEDPYLKIGEANDRSKKGESEYVWSLRDINFEIKQGDAVGIIGKNGAGKSTLLKLLSKVTKPTTGKIYTNGRIASLLEVGTGFHPEMTGRENIYLNGAILGMTRKEITRKFDEIVDFSGVERYIDTPVKRYSSGMYVRLAFAVAAHLESEILIVDEVLAVGDAEFQKKCLGKMGDVSKGEGRTVLFVSHNISAIKSLCNSGIVLQNGKILTLGSVDNCVNRYLEGSHGAKSNQSYFHNFKNNIFELHEISFKNLNDNFETNLFDHRDIQCITKFTLNSDHPHRYHLTYHLINDIGETLFSFGNYSTDVKLKSGVNELICNFPAYFFQSGNYFLNIFVVEDKKKPILQEREIVTFSIYDGERDLGDNMNREPGYIRPQFVWENI